MNSGPADETFAVMWSYLMLLSLLQGYILASKGDRLSLQNPSNQSSVDVQRNGRTRYDNYGDNDWSEKMTRGGERYGGVEIGNIAKEKRVKKLAAMRQLTTEKPKITDELKDDVTSECGISSNKLAIRWDPNPETMINRNRKRYRSIYTHKRIFGGSKLEQDEFPWLVQISSEYYFKQGADKRMRRCGGTIISKLYVLTSGACIIDTHWSIVEAGTVDLDSPDDDGGEFRQTRKVESIFVYEGEFVASGLALIKVDKPFQWNDHVRPVCLPPNTGQLPGDKTVNNVTIAGWGAITYNKKASDFNQSNPLAHAVYPSVARAVILPLSSVDDCRRVFVESNEIFDPAYMLCSNKAKRVNDHNGREVSLTACDKDLGGPALILDKNQRWQIYGVIKSVGEDCDNSPLSIYTKVIMFNEWINATITRGYRPVDPKTGQLDDVCGFNPHQRFRSPDKRRKMKRHGNHTWLDDETDSKIAKRVFNGREAYIGEVPWFVHLTPVGCGGTIIHKEFILTAAHCVNKFWKNFLSLTVTAGMYERWTFSTADTEQSRQAILEIQHPEWIDSYQPLWGPDFAIVKLDKPLEWTEWVRPACLPPLWQSVEPEPLLLTGFGMQGIKWKFIDFIPAFIQTPYQFVWSSKLRVASIPGIGPQEPCLKDINQTFSFCILQQWSDGKGICFGDSGSPVLHESSENRWYVHGVASAGTDDPPDCSNGASIMSRVSYARRWIVETVINHTTT